MHQDCTLAHPGDHTRQTSIKFCGNHLKARFAQALHGENFNYGYQYNYCISWAYRGTNTIKWVCSVLLKCADCIRTCNLRISLHTSTTFLSFPSIIHFVWHACIQTIQINLGKQHFVAVNGNPLPLCSMWSWIVSPTDNCSLELLPLFVHFQALNVSSSFIFS